MKKALVILLAIVVAGGAFAADLSGAVIGHIIPMQGNSEEDGITAGGKWIRTEVSGSGQNEAGTFGGWVRLRATAISSDGTPVNGWGYMWWKPIEQFKFQIGGNPSGFFLVNEIVGSGFHTDAGDAGVAMEGKKFTASLYSGWVSNGALLTITPMEALAINIGIPFIDNAGKSGEENYKKTTAQVAYTIDSIGRIAVTYAGGLMGKLGDEDKGLDTGSTIYGSFLLTAVENLSVNLGAGFTTPVDNTFGKRSAPIAVGLGADYNAGLFGVKGRVQGQFAGSTTVGGVETKDDMNIIADVMPYFAIDDTFKIFLNLGLNVSIPDNGDDTVMGWQVNPYISKAVIGGGLFFAGLQVHSNGGDNATINWGVPIGMVYKW